MLGVNGASDRRAARPIDERAGDVRRLATLAAGNAQRLGSLLLDAGRLASPAEVTEVLGEQSRTGEKFGDVLVRTGRINAAERDVAVDFQRHQRGEIGRAHV